MKKILIIRFSSIGDIVLTSPVIRCLKHQYPAVELHFLTKKAFESIVSSNPAIDQVITINKEIDEIKPRLKKEDYDFVVDLHHNLRTFRLKRILGKPSATFPKLNIQKFLLTFFKLKHLPEVHIVDRYFKAVERLGVKNDGQGLDFFIPSRDEIELESIGLKTPFVAIAIGAQFATKRLPPEKLSEIISKIHLPIVLLGGPSDSDIARLLVAQFPKIVDCTGKLNLNQSASILKQAHKVISHDTGLMHIASAFKIPIISVWGNTVPAFGMYPYLPQQPELVKIHEVDISCRPCSKIGFSTCPKKHFNCMNFQDTDAIARDANE